MSRTLSAKRDNPDASIPRHRQAFLAWGGNGLASPNYSTVLYKNPLHTLVRCYALSLQNTGRTSQTPVLPRSRGFVDASVDINDFEIWWVTGVPSAMSSERRHCIVLYKLSAPLSIARAVISTPTPTPRQELCPCRYSNQSPSINTPMLPLVAFS